MKQLMAFLIIALISLTVFSSPCPAKDMYVGDITRLNLRSGKGVKFDIIATLPSGEKVNAVSFSGGWTQIETEDGKQGWVVSKYLTGEKPADLKIEDLKIRMETLQAQLEMALIENTKLQEQNLSLTTRLNETGLQMGNLESAFAALQEDSKEYLALKEKFDQIAKEAAQKDARIRTLEDQVNDQYISIAMKWTLTGAAILLVGFFLGSRTKQKRSSLL